MKPIDKNIHFLKRDETLDGIATTGVSLHCHSLHSKELLDFVPYYAERIPVVKQLWRREMRRREAEFGARPDFRSGYWEPPLTGKELIASESANLAGLGLSPIVSITDHDSISANLALQGEAADVPVSMEWTVPFENAFFHIGVHNMPVERSTAITAELLDYTHAQGLPDDDRLTELFVMLNEIPDLLVVLNHPIWDIEMIGQRAHEQALERFLGRHRDSLHAVEINGFRAWSENQMVIDLGERTGLPVISGGDRHCCQPNTMFNVTDAGSFSEFVAEIRVDGHSRIGVTPSYHHPLPSRQLASMAQILGDYQNFPEGRKLWSDRIFLDAQDGTGLRSLTDQWNGTRPMWSHVAIAALRIMSHRWMRPIIAAAVGDTDIGREERTAGRIDETLSALNTNGLNPESI